VPVIAWLVTLLHVMAIRLTAAAVGLAKAINFSVRVIPSPFY